MKKFLTLFLALALTALFAATAMAGPSKSDNFVEGLGGDGNVSATVDGANCSFYEWGMTSQDLIAMLDANSISALGDVKICGGFGIQVPSDAATSEVTGKTFAIPFAAANADKLPATYKIAFAKQVLSGESYTTFTNVVTASSASHVISADNTEVATLTVNFAEDFTISTDVFWVYFIESSGSSSVTGVTVSLTALSLNIGDIYTLTAAVKPDTAAQTVTWKSDKEAVATVDASGKVKAVALGTAVITATSTADTTKSASCTVTVADLKKPVIDTSITVPASVDVTQETVPYTDAGSAAKDISCDIASSDIEVKDGKAYVKSDTVKDAISTVLTENETLNGATALPIFSITTDKDVVAACARVKGSDLLADNVKDVTIFKLLSKSSTLEFKYTATPAEFADGKFTILDADGKIASGAIKADDTYQVLLFIKDGGDYDMDGAKNGAVIDPAAIASISEKTSGGSSSGCSAGFGIFALLALTPLAFRRKK